MLSFLLKQFSHPSFPPDSPNLAIMWHVLVCSQPPPPPPQFSLIPLSVSSLLCLMVDLDVDSCCRCCMILARRAATTTTEPPTPSSNRSTAPLPTTDHDVQVRIRLHFWHAHLIKCQSCSMSIVMVLSHATSLILMLAMSCIVT